jgi:hypothetical protein
VLHLVGKYSQILNNPEKSFQVKNTLAYSYPPSVIAKSFAGILEGRKKQCI